MGTDLSTPLRSAQDDIGSGLPRACNMVEMTHRDREVAAIGGGDFSTPLRFAQDDSIFSGVANL